MGEWLHGGKYADHVFLILHPDEECVFVGKTACAHFPQFGRKIRSYKDRVIFNADLPVGRGDLESYLVALTQTPSRLQAGFPPFEYQPAEPNIFDASGGVVTVWCL